MDRLSDFFFASCIAWSMEHGQKTGHASARTLFGETTTAVKRVLLLAPNYLAANNRNSCKAIVFLTPMHPVLAASSSSEKRTTATQHAHLNIVNPFEQKRKEETYLASKSAVHRRYFVPNHNPQPPTHSSARSPPPQSQAITQPHPTSILRRSQTYTSLNNTRHGTAETSCLVRAALLASKLVRQNHNHV